MNNKEIIIKKKLLAKRNDIKRKLNILRHGQIIQENLFSPITKHLKNIEGRLPKKKKNNSSKKNEYLDDFPFDMQTKQERKTENNDYVDDRGDSDNDFDINNYSDDNDDNFETPKKSKDLVSQFSTPVSTKKASVVDEDIFDVNTDEDPQTSSMNSTTNSEEAIQNYLDQFEALPRKYISEMLSIEKQREFDRKYGVRNDPSLTKFYIGNAALKIRGADIMVKNKTYKGTRGLYELLFKLDPKNYTEDDLKSYRDIVLKTNANRRHYKPGNQIDGSKLQKYKNIIAPMTGDGLLKEVTNNQIDYIHWDDPNELCSRLRLLFASKQAGHSGHINEIASIVEELREAQIIK